MDRYILESRLLAIFPWGYNKTSITLHDDIHNWCEGVVMQPRYMRLWCFASDLVVIPLTILSIYWRLIQQAWETHKVNKYQILSSGRLLTVLMPVVLHMRDPNLVITVPGDVLSPDDVIQNGRRDNVKSRGTSSVDHYYHYHTFIACLNYISIQLTKCNTWWWTLITNL